MKKFFVAVALVMGLGTTVAFAGNLTSGVETVSYTHLTLPTTPYV